jgi:DhnA family fructose-bisphosphate aldolase class Ia
MAAEVMTSGAKGMTIGRNIWGAPQVAQALSAFKLVIHEGVEPGQAMTQAGLA